MAISLSLGPCPAGLGWARHRREHVPTYSEYRNGSSGWGSSMGGAGGVDPSLCSLYVGTCSLLCHHRRNLRRQQLEKTQSRQSMKPSLHLVLGIRCLEVQISFSL
jgi:hypothetical protein